MTEDMVKVRQPGYTFMSWNMGKINAQVVDGTAIAAIAKSGMGALHSPVTLEASGGKETWLPPSFEEQGRACRWP